MPCGLCDRVPCVAKCDSDTFLETRSLEAQISRLNFHQYLYFGVGMPLPQLCDAGQCTTQPLFKNLQTTLEYAPFLLTMTPKQ